MCADKFISWNAYVSSDICQFWHMYVETYVYNDTHMYYLPPLSQNGIEPPELRIWMIIKEIDKEFETHTKGKINNIYAVSCHWTRMYVETYVSEDICLFRHTYILIHMYVETYVCWDICMFRHMYFKTYVNCLRRRVRLPVGSTFDRLILQIVNAFILQNSTQRTGALLECSPTQWRVAWNVI